MVQSRSRGGPSAEPGVVRATATVLTLLHSIIYIIFFRLRSEGLSAVRLFLRGEMSEKKKIDWMSSEDA